MRCHSRITMFAHQKGTTYMGFTKDDIRRIKEAAKGRLLEVIGDFRELRRRGKDYVCDCPQCGGKEKLSVSPSKEIF